MKKILIAVIFLFVVSCSEEEDRSEIDLMSTLCIDGVLNLSVVDGNRCFYVPLREECGDFIKCRR